MLVVLLSGACMRCPICRKLWARKSKGKEEVGRKGGYKMVERYDIQRDAKGKKIGEIARQEYVHVVQATYQNYWQCKHCQRMWTTLSTSKYE